MALLHLVAALVLTSGCRGSEGKTLTVAGSTTILTAATAAAEEFDSRHPDLKVRVQGGGSSAGIEAVSTGTADIGMSSRELKGEETGLGLVDTPVAVDGIAIIINPNNDMDGLTSAQAKMVFQGNLTNWKDLGGPDSPILLVDRDEGSGTREAFWKKIMDEEEFDREAVVLPGTGQVRAAVAGTPGAIGYISFGYVTTAVKALDLDGVRPSVKTIKSGAYPLHRKLHLFTKGDPKALAKEFIDYVLSPKIQKDIIGVEFVPIR